MALRWTSTYTVEWTPILTFGRKRWALLDWIDKNVEPVGFVDRPNLVGISVVRPDLRLLVGRSGMRIDTGLSGADSAHLAKPIDGVFSVLQPKDAVLDGVNTVMSVRLAGTSYEEATARFARQSGGLAKQLSSGYRPTDASLLMDFDHEDVHAQAEWGVVSADELVERLTDRDMGRITISGATEQAPMGADEFRLLRGDEVPPVSLFVEVVHTRKYGGGVSSAEELFSLASQLDDAAGVIADEAARSLGVEEEKAS